VWEDFWHDCPSADRRFYQSLIQAAVAIYHWERGNMTGARRLFDSGSRYMAAYGPYHRGLDVSAFWADMRHALAGLFADPPVRSALVPPPVIALAPPPRLWPTDEIIVRLLHLSEDGK
jgi:predicted metal-dependent hydrolase